ncbi:MAG TPA: hypothetical protein VHK91_15430 [Flavisolibacter sp.]|jgi:hypothetical protein|nr:hypothetical protein [Flavisolibacter sp.]
MKKLLGILAIAGVLTACNNAADSTGEKKDSVDSVGSATKDVIDSTADANKDKVDSLTDAKKETLEKMDSLNKKDSTKK